MTIKTLTAAALLIVLPVLANAMCGETRHEAASCADGTTWDAASQRCVVKGTS